MDKETIIKYFNVGDEIEIATPNELSSGKIIEYSDTALVIEDIYGSPIIIALDTVL